MIITENVTINDVQYKYTKSSLGYYIQRNDGKQFIDAYDDRTCFDIGRNTTQNGYQHVGS